jgi:lysophospholipase L1-like esterase
MREKVYLKYVKRRYLAPVILIILAIICSFTYGMATVYLRIFPFSQVQMLFRFSNSDPEYSNYYLIKKSIFDERNEEEYDFVFVGDSLIDMAEWNEIIPNVKVANRGISGDTTLGLINRLDSVLSTSAQKAFVMIGRNDLVAGSSIDQVVENYKIILEELVRRKMTVLIQSLLYVEENKASLNSSIRETNFRLQGLAANHDAIRFIDLNGGLAPDGYLDSKYSFDGSHLNGKGYSIWHAIISHEIY